MATIIDMPKLSDTMTVGTLVSWLKKVGDPVKSGDMLAEVETDKATMELENFEDGVILAQYVKEGDQVPIGSPILVIGKAGETAPPAPAGKGAVVKAPAPAPAAPAPAPKAASAPAPVVVAAPPPPPPPAPAPVAPAPVVSGDGRIKASPLARKVATEKGVDLRTVQGSGPDGRIVRADVEAAAVAPPAPAPAPVVPAEAAPAPAPAAPAKAPAPVVMMGTGVQTEASVPVTAMRATIARRLLESKTTVPHFYVEMEMDAAPLVTLREKLNGSLAELAPDKGGIKFTINDFIMKAAAEALRRVPELNVSWMGDTIQRHSSVHMAFGVALEDGLVTPVIRDCQAKGLRQISLEAKEWIGKAKAKKLKPADMSGSTFTISNPGMLGVDFFYAIINPPNAAILSVGAIQKKPVVNAQDAIVVGTRMRFGLSVDHRAVDGATGILYLRALKEIIESPAVMLV